MENINKPFHHQKFGKGHFTISETEPLSRPTNFQEENEKRHVRDDPDPDSSLSDSSLKKNKRDKKKKRQKYRKDDSSDPSSRDDFDFSDDSDYRRKKTYEEKQSGKGSNKIMRTFNGKVADDSI